MRSCSHCNKMHLCKFYEKFQKTYTEGLKSRSLASGSSEKTTTTYASMSIFGGIARACGDFESIHEELSDDWKVKVDKQVEKMQEDGEFIQEFFSSKSPEHRIELIQEYLDGFFDGDDDLSESIMAYFLEKFSY